jgi:hypothetical protein
MAQFTVMTLPISDNPDGNKVVNTSKVIQNNKGHAVYVYNYNTPYYKETTVGPEVELFYNYGNISGGWD